MYFTQYSWFDVTIPFILLFSHTSVAVSSYKYTQNAGASIRAQGNNGKKLSSLENGKNLFYFCLLLLFSLCKNHNSFLDFVLVCLGFEFKCHEILYAVYMNTNTIYYFRLFFDWHIYLSVATAHVCAMCRAGRELNLRVKYCIYDNSEKFPSATVDIIYIYIAIMMRW